jgi:hypothetical protein
MIHTVVKELVTGAESVVDTTRVGRIEGAVAVLIDVNVDGREKALVDGVGGE